MKTGHVCQSDAIDTGNSSTFCGIVTQTTPDNTCSIPDARVGLAAPILGDGVIVGKQLVNILATRRVNNWGDVCALPKANYHIWNPFALGNINELDYLKFDSGMLTVDYSRNPKAGNVSTSSPDGFF